MSAAIHLFMQIFPFFPRVQVSGGDDSSIIISSYLTGKSVSTIARYKFFFLSLLKLNLHSFASLSLLPAFVFNDKSIYSASSSCSVPSFVCSLEVCIRNKISLRGIFIMVIRARSRKRFWIAAESQFHSLRLTRFSHFWCSNPSFHRTSPFHRPSV